MLDFDDDFDTDSDIPQDDDSEDLDPVYATLSDYVTEFFAPMCSYRLSISAGRGLRWDPHWYRWPQVRIRLDYLWKTWEIAYSSRSPQDMADWWLHIFDPTVRVLLDGENGPLNSYNEAAADYIDDDIVPILPCESWDGTIPSQEDD